jgi:hypothetical protein
MRKRRKKEHAQRREDFSEFLSFSLLDLFSSLDGAARW